MFLAAGTCALADLVLLSALPAALKGAAASSATAFAAVDGARG
jgi:hypothetical protein